MRRFFALLAAVALVSWGAAPGCGGDATLPAVEDAGPPPDPQSWAVTAAGPYLCGHRQVEMTYPPLGGLPKRTIPVHYWYPASKESDDHPVYAAIFTDKTAWEDAPVAPSPYPRGFPVLVHGHGWRGFAGNSARLMCHFASHGWLAVAPEHVGNLLGDTPDKLPLAVYLHRPLDIRAALDFTAAMPSTEPLAGKADLGHVAMSGHSFGSYDAWVAGGATLKSELVRAKCTSGDITHCTEEQIAVFDTDLSDRRAKIVMHLAGVSSDFMDEGSHGATRVPVLMMSGSLDDVGAEPAFAKSTKLDLTWVVVDGGCHQLFGLGNMVVGKPECAVLPDEKGFALVNPWILAYARYHVLADRTPTVRGLVEGTTSLSPLMHFQHKSP